MSSQQQHETTTAAAASSSSPALLFEDRAALAAAAAAAAAGTGATGAGGIGTGGRAIDRVIVHPLVLLHILDHHSRRQEENGRVIGTLLGRHGGGVDGRTVEISNSFAVPHAERGDEVAIGKDFNKTMLGLHLRMNRKEVVVGWYASAQAASGDGGAGALPLLSDTSSLIHEFYAGETEEGGDPVHLVVDTRLLTNQVQIRAYKSTPVILQGEQLGNLFHELRLSLQSNEPETICLHKMIQEQQQEDQEHGQLAAGGENGNTATADNDEEDDDAGDTANTAASLRVSMEQLYMHLETVLEYVDSVVDGKTVPARPEMGRLLADTCAAVPRIRPAVFDRLFHDSLQDLLMVTYLSNVTRTQLTIAEKLNASLGM